MARETSRYWLRALQKYLDCSGPKSKVLLEKYKVAVDYAAVKAFPGLAIAILGGAIGFGIATIVSTNPYAGAAAAAAFAVAGTALGLQGMLDAAKASEDFAIDARAIHETCKKESGIKDDALLKLLRR